MKVCWLVFGSPMARNNQPYARLKERLENEDLDQKHATMRGFFDLIAEASKTLKELFTKEEKEGNVFSDSDSVLEKIRHHPSHLAILPIIISLYHSKAHKNINEKDKLTVLELIEKLNFRYYVTGLSSRNDSHHSELFNMAFDFYHGVELKPEDSDKSNRVRDIHTLIQQITQFILKKAPMSEVINELTLNEKSPRDFYKWQGLKYFLACYDIKDIPANRTKGLSKVMVRPDRKSRGDGYHLEHIWATKDSALLDAMQDDKKLSAKITEWEQSISFNKRRLGNFMLLPSKLNISVSNKSIEQKHLEYKDQMQSPEHFSQNMSKATMELFFNALETTSKPENSFKTNKLKYYSNIIKFIEQDYLRFLEENWGINI